jgi:hypothetical protein
MSRLALADDNVERMRCLSWDVPYLLLIGPGRYLPLYSIRIVLIIRTKQDNQSRGQMNDRLGDRIRLETLEHR